MEDGETYRKNLTKKLSKIGLNEAFLNSIKSGKL
jgi:hypothetical protein